MASSHVRAMAQDAKVRSTLYSKSPQADHLLRYANLLHSRAPIDPRIHPEILVQLRPERVSFPCLQEGFRCFKLFCARSLNPSRSECSSPPTSFPITTT